MKILPNGIAVLPFDLISGWVESEGKLAHDNNQLPRILPLIRPGDVVVDAGAFIGDHTVAYAQAVEITGKVYAYEPNPAAYECLTHNMRLFPHVQCFNAALGATDCHALMRVDPANQGASTLVPLFGDNPTADAPVLVKKLDDLTLPRLNLIKLDCEGFEPFVIMGGSDTLDRCRPIIVCEVNEIALARQGFTANDLLMILAARRYRIANIYPEQPLSGPQFDVICTPLP